MILLKLAAVALYVLVAWVLVLTWGAVLLAVDGSLWVGGRLYVLWTRKTREKSQISS